jgi:hypothetical protein
MMHGDMMIKRILTSSLVCSGLLMSCAATNEPTHTTICALVAKPKDFLNRELAIHAIWSASYHGVLLQDEACPKVGMSVQYPEESEMRGSVSEFKDLAFGNKNIDAKPRKPDSFTGRLIIYPGEIPYLVLELHSFSSP